MRRACERARLRETRAFISTAARLHIPAWIRALGRLWGLRPEVVPPEARSRCRELLCDVYQREMGWMPPAGNPSDLRVTDGPAPELVDAFDDRAVWLGIFAGEELVACVRVIPPGPDGLEVTRYHPVPDEFLAGAMEVNRLAIRRGHRGKGTFALVALLLRWIARELGVPRALFAAEEPLSRKPYRPLGWRFTGVSFRYHPEDRHPCELLVLESGGLHLAKSLTRTVLRSSLGVLGLRRRKPASTAPAPKAPDEAPVPARTGTDRA